MGSIPGLERSPGEENGNLPQYSFLENSRHRGAWWAIAQWGSKELNTTEQLSTVLVIQWLGTHLPMQEAQVPSLTWGDPTWPGATNPKCHHYRASTLESTSWVFFFFLILNCMSCLFILEINPQSVSLFANMKNISYSVGCVFILFMTSFAMQSF